MSIDIRLPNITGTTEKEQLQQVKSYLYQFAEQLKWAFNTLETGGSHESGRDTIVLSNTAETAIESENNFNSIKSLIIKSADIVDAYYEEINKRLEGEYLAISDFGTYSEQTDLDIKANSKAISQHYNNIQTLETSLDGVKNSIIDTEAYIRTGLLDYANNGTPIYGVEVGQTNDVNGSNVFNKFSRFTSDRLSFYDGSTEVAWISGYKLYITNAEIKGILKLGGYEIDTTDGLAFNWVGRG